MTVQTEHREIGGWKNGPGECGVECACGTTFDGFDTLAEAAEHLETHIRQALPQNKRADELVFGDRVFDGGDVTTVAYGQTNGDVRLTVFANGSIWQSSPGALRRLATAEDVAEREQAARRIGVADSLESLAALIRDGKLPLGNAPSFSFGVVRSRVELSRWSLVAGADIEISGVDIPVVYGRIGTIEVRGQCQPDPQPVEPTPLRECARCTAAVEFLNNVELCEDCEKELAALAMADAAPKPAPDVWPVPTAHRVTGPAETFETDRYSTGGTEA